MCSAMFATRNGQYEPMPNTCSISQYTSRGGVIQWPSCAVNNQSPTPSCSRIARRVSTNAQSSRMNHWWRPMYQKITTPTPSTAIDTCVGVGIGRRAGADPAVDRGRPGRRLVRHVGRHRCLTTMRHHSCRSCRALRAIAGSRKNCDRPDGRA